MFEKILDVIRANRERLDERLTARILESIPRYSVSGGPQLRENVAALAGGMLMSLEHQDDKDLTQRLVAISRQRTLQGFHISDYLRAILAAFPVLREIIRETKQAADPSFAEEYARFEDAMFGIVGKASDIFASDLLRQLESKNQELNRLCQKLCAQERALALEADQASQALEAANEFNQRVIDSLIAGMLVIDSKTLKVTLFTSRMEEITGLPSEEVLGRDAGEVFLRIEGLPIADLIQAVQANGRLPITKFNLRRPDGRAFSVLVRAERFWDREGNPEGTVVLVDDVSERELLLDSFSRYVSRDLVRRVLAQAEPLNLGGEKHTCTMLFADIRGFTGLAETLEAEQLHELLNAYFRVIIDVINARGGFIDKFIGDNVMAIFDWRTSQEKAARAALLAAQEIVQHMDALNVERQKNGLPTIEIGVGVNTGEVLLGNVGSEERMDFTAIGDPVNVAARLQAQALAGQVLVGKTTAELASSALPIESRGMKQLRGRKKPVEVFELVLS